MDQKIRAEEHLEVLDKFTKLISKIQLPACRNRTLERPRHEEKPGTIQRDDRLARRRRRAIIIQAISRDGGPYRCRSLIPTASQNLSFSCSASPRKNGKSISIS